MFLELLNDIVTASDRNRRLVHYDSYLELLATGAVSPIALPAVSTIYALRNSVTWLAVHTSAFTTLMAELPATTTAMTGTFMKIIPFLSPVVISENGRVTYQCQVLLCALLYEQRY